MAQAWAMRVVVPRILVPAEKRSKQYWKRLLRRDTFPEKIVFSHWIQPRVSFTMGSRTYSRKVISERCRVIKWLNTGKNGLRSIQLFRLKTGWRKTIGLAGRL